MDIIRYRQRREQIGHVNTRTICTICLQPDFTCYCAHIRAFDPKIKFVILIHPIEARRRIATGRMSHFCLKGSELIEGHEYSANPRVNELLADPALQPFVLYPGRNSTNLTPLQPHERAALFDSSKQTVIFVIDGTWNTARKTMHLSENLKTVPRIGFTPPGPSAFRVRKQPSEECYSTIEAIHHTIELLGEAHGFETGAREHDNLLYAFNQMVKRRVELAQQPGRRQLRLLHSRFR
ncbi:MAG TPA: tRNA-uridine aminocarboxypropyltransferase [Bdellovibrionales bacterium]|nr:tRNA-uridine aminocarboxypropyltransferase [Bdellovibrionales bacterium]